VFLSSVEPPFLRPGLRIGTAPRTAAVKTGRRPSRSDAVLTAASTGRALLRSKALLHSLGRLSHLINIRSVQSSQAGLPPRYVFPLTTGRKSRAPAEEHPLTALAITKPPRSTEYRLSQRADKGQRARDGGHLLIRIKKVRHPCAQRHGCLQSCGIGRKRTRGQSDRIACPCSVYRKWDPCGNRRIWEFRLT